VRFTASSKQRTFTHYSAVPQEPTRKQGHKLRSSLKNQILELMHRRHSAKRGCCSFGDGKCLEGEEPAREVTLTTGFWLAQTTATMRTWQKYHLATGVASLPVMDDHGHKLNDPHTGDRMPVNGLTWQEAVHLCAWAGGRLPTEAEWEYAARAGTIGVRYGDLDSIAWYGSNSGKNRLDSEKLWEADRRKYAGMLLENENNPHAVRLKQPNSWNLYDMLGNVWQWTADWYDPGYYAHTENVDPSGPLTGKLKVLRGGSWGEAPTTVRVSIRGRDEPDGRSSTFGVRCVWQ
jgi:sulfatase modifying factor 1